MGVYADAVLADSPALYWKLDDASGNPQDSSGNGRHADSVLTPNYRQAGVGALLDPLSDGQYSLGFDAGDYVRRTTMTGLNATDNFTVECWVFDAEDTDGLIYEHGRAIAVGTGIYLKYDAASNKLKVFEGGGGLLCCESDGAFPLSDWTHVVVLRAAGVFKMYVDGVVQAVQNNRTVTAPTGIALARANDNATFQNAERLAHFAIYQTVLLPERILAHAQGGLLSLPKGSMLRTAAGIF